ncbi:Signal transduction histidine kinase [Paraburkholderia fungorum]|uniref:histidine kinase n=2 Tax=Paraburkholderia fungorum TaxID=134537 RepID=A0A1H1JVU3_9BURK|nr:Signal transduction histidine kinase [Paraburkholderia fungorum]
MLMNVSRSRSVSGDLDHFAFMVIADRHKFEQELRKARSDAEAALIAKHEAEEDLRRAARRKDEFLATLAHELRNPLAPMRSTVDLLRARRLDDQRAAWAYGVLDRQLAQVPHLVDDLLDVSRINEGKIELRRAPTDLEEIMRTALEGSLPRITAAAHQLSVSVPAEPLTVDADPTRLSQIMQNLLNNAAKYTPSGGNIWFAAHREGNHAVISVRDSGIGMHADDLPSMFGLFTQLPGGKQYSQGGLGVGLALVRMLTTLHGGTVSASSEGIGKGSEFFVRLPLCSPTAEESSVRPMALVEPHRILIVDDNHDAVDSMAMLLELEGHTVWRAADGQSALRLAEENRIDVALLDIGLPDMSGHELARRMRKSSGGDDLLLVAVTGWGQPEDVQKAKDAGFDLHFTKPVNLDQLREAMSTAS